MLTDLKRLVAGTGLERPARRLLALTSSRSARKNSRDDEVLRALIRSLPSDASCVDVGANLGHILGEMVHGCPEGRHVAFEPVPWLAEDLRRRYPRVDVRAEAVSDAAGSVAFTVVRKKPSRSGISATLDLTIDATVEEIQTATVRLDDALPTDFRPALIKVDVEGGELQALEGGRRVLSAHRPILAVEHQYGRRKEPERTQRIYDLLDEIGYELRTVAGRSVDRQEFLQLVDSRTEWNFFAYPR
jgi:FkbM family methyltransferase